MWPRRRKFVGPLVSRVTWHGGRGYAYLRRWAFFIAPGPCWSNRRSSAGFAGAIRCSGGGIGRGAEPPSEFSAGEKVVHEPDQLPAVVQLHPERGPEGRRTVW